MITIATCPAPIHTMFDRHLLADFLQRCDFRLEDIVSLAAKKIRPQDTAKRRKFEKLVIAYKELHVRKTIEKDEYERKVKEKMEKRPHFQNVGTTARFRRMDTGK